MAFYVYKVKTDAGGAPCVYRRVLSLAICKPAIRSSAEPGDWIFGFGAQRLGERLVYIAEVTGKERHGEYYRRREFAKRPDCVYRWRDGALSVRTDARFHADGKGATKDLGAAPRYERANVLLSRNFRYFGDAEMTEWKQKFPRLRARIETLKQGHRVHHDPRVRSELAALRDWLWSEHPVRSVLGRPSDAEVPGCDVEDDDDEGFTC